MTIKDVDDLRHRIDTLVRAATRIRIHAGDLHSLAWDRSVTGAEKVRETRTDYVPLVLDEAPVARRLLTRIFDEVERIEAELVGLDRTMIAIFTSHSERPDPSRGSMISVDDHDRLQARQRRRRVDGEFTPTLLEAQPQHPGRRK